MFTIDVADGKYRVTNTKGILNVQRNGEPWPAKTAVLIGDGFVLALVQKLEELECEIEELENEIDAINCHAQEMD